RNNIKSSITFGRDASGGQLSDRGYRIHSTGHIAPKMVRINGHVRSQFPAEPARRCGGTGGRRSASTQ
ncbi:MAG: hypothetical protein WBW26_12900, partial [Bradyrhizobium sp.]